jgi:hypothetical protein
LADKETKSEAKPQPVFKSQLSSLQLAVWANSHEVEGETRTFYTINLERNYRDKHDEWHKTTQLRERDIGPAIALLQRAQFRLMKSEEG